MLGGHITEVHYYLLMQGTLYLQFVVQHRAIPEPSVTQNRMAVYASPTVKVWLISRSRRSEEVGRQYNGEALGAVWVCIPWDLEEQGMTLLKHKSLRGRDKVHVKTFALTGESQELCYQKRYQPFKTAEGISSLEGRKSLEFSVPIEARSLHIFKVEIDKYLKGLTFKGYGEKTELRPAQIRNNDTECRVGLRSLLANSMYSCGSFVLVCCSQK